MYRARSRELILSVPVVVMTGHDTAEARVRAAEMGAKVYLCKPINDEALLAAIDEAVGNVHQGLWCR